MKGRDIAVAPINRVKQKLISALFHPNSAVNGKTNRPNAAKANGPGPVDIQIAQAPTIHHPKKMPLPFPAGVSAIVIVFLWSLLKDAESQLESFRYITGKPEGLLKRIS
jgi:hypothetical protein